MAVDAVLFGLCLFWVKFKSFQLNKDVFGCFAQPQCSAVYSSVFQAAAAWTGAACVCNACEASVFSVCVYVHISPLTAASGGYELRLHHDRLTLLSALMSVWVFLRGGEVSEVFFLVSRLSLICRVPCSDWVAPSLIPVRLTCISDLIMLHRAVVLITQLIFLTYKHPLVLDYSPQGYISAYVGIFTASTKPGGQCLLSRLNYVSQGILFISSRGKKKSISHFFPLPIRPERWKFPC